MFNPTARLIFWIREAFDHISSALFKFHWLPLVNLVHFKLLRLVYTAINNQGPKYIKDFLHAHSITAHRLGSCDRGLLKVLRTNYKTFGDHAFAYSAPFLWNKLSLEIRYSSSSLLKSAGRRLNELPLEVWPSPSSRKIYYEWWNGMPFVIWQAAGKLTNNTTIFGAKMHHCTENTALCEQISTVNKVDKNVFWMYRTTVKQKALQSLTHNVSSSIECTSFSKTLDPLVWEKIWSLDFLSNLLGTSFYWRSPKRSLIIPYWRLTGISKISSAKVNFSFSCFSTPDPYFLKYFLAQIRDTLMSGSLEMGVFPTKLFRKWVLSVTKKNLRIAGFFLSTPFLPHLCY